MSIEPTNPRNLNEPGYREMHLVPKKGTANRGFAAMSTDQQKRIASKGGEAVSKNRGHMAEIGKKGGEIVSKNRKHMSEIGRKGGEASKASRNNGNGKP